MTSNTIYSILESKRHNPHYLKRYFNFILGCKNKNVNLSISIYVENHHICPKANDMFPEYGNNKIHTWNNIKLTAKQHFIAHHLLWKAFPNTSMTYTFKCFL